MSVFTKFESIEPKEFVWAKLNKFNQTPDTRTPLLYEWENFVNFAGPQKAIEILTEPQDDEGYFLWKPSVINFWKYVKKHNLVIYDHLSPAIIGFVIKTGGLWHPEAVVYDIDVAFDAYRKTYRDSAMKESKRLFKQLNEFDDIVWYKHVTASPWFCRLYTSKVYKNEIISNM